MKLFEQLHQWWVKRERKKVLRIHIDLLTSFLSDYPADITTKRMVLAELIRTKTELDKLEK